MGRTLPGVLGRDGDGDECRRGEETPETCLHDSTFSARERPRSGVDVIIHDPGSDVQVGGGGGRSPSQTSEASTMVDPVGICSNLCS